MNKKNGFFFTDMKSTKFSQILLLNISHKIPYFHIFFEERAYKYILV